MNPSIACNPLAKSKRELRARLLEARFSAALEASSNESLSRQVIEVLKRFEPTRVGFYWPLRGEFDARRAIAVWLALDPRREAALPVIPRKHEPLVFHAWSPDMPMQPGHHQIPEPTSARVVIPDLLLIPCVGFDAEGYRLGYGGGYYDRTLATWPGEKKPVTVGIAYEACRVDALHRETHDIPLDAIITDTCSYPVMVG
ncbi:5-formyltetrahydrofolate cyclo-ligase [Paraburkholderia phosphatilytica]|uniref:5-formyltetrahydrofolate cyclo-ligase n=1 Tax=Paraburkholderia phosphatilytica TaxID=2282883 RepID=UPI000E4DDED3|nr:5-formyltetrahydrofolate cyclo-ligase [Paraburkholderia phosphatilytica]